MTIRYALTIAASFTLIATVLAANNYRPIGVFGLMPKAEVAYVEPLSSEPQGLGPIRNLRFTLFSAGIRPNQMRIKAGLVNIHFEDRTNSSQALTLQRVTPAEPVAFGTVQKVANQPRGRNSFRLTPGEYELFDASQPSNKAVLLVEP